MSPPPTSCTPPSPPQTSPWWSTVRRLPWRTYYRPASIRLVGQKFAAHDDLNPIPRGIRFPPDVHPEVDRAHDSIAKLLLDQLLEGSAVYTHQLVEAIDQ